MEGMGEIEGMVFRMAGWWAWHGGELKGTERGVRPVNQQSDAERDPPRTRRAGGVPLTRPDLGATPQR